MKYHLVVDKSVSLGAIVTSTISKYHKQMWTDKTDWARFLKIHIRPNEIIPE